MKLGLILNDLAGDLIETLPYSGAILAVVNAILPKNLEINGRESGKEVLRRIESLDPKEQTALLSKKIDLQIVESNNFATNLKTLAEVDMTGNSTRPAIAKMQSQVLCFSIVVMVLMFAYSVYIEGEGALEVLMSNWAFVVALLSIPAGIINIYFGMRTSEKKTRYNQAGGGKLQGTLGSIIASIKK